MKSEFFVCSRGKKLGRKGCFSKLPKHRASDLVSAEEVYTFRLLSKGCWRVLEGHPLQLDSSEENPNFAHHFCDPGSQSLLLLLTSDHFVQLPLV